MSETRPSSAGNDAGLTDEQMLIVEATRQTLSDLADDWPDEPMTRAEAVAFILDQPIALAPDPDRRAPLTSGPVATPDSGEAATDPPVGTPLPTGGSDA